MGIPFAALPSKLHLGAKAGHRGMDTQAPAQVAAISVIIVSYNTRDLLRDCLQSLLRSEGRSCELIVVDNASADDSAEMVAREFPSVRLIRSDANLGFAKGVNLGLRLARGEYLLLLNSDTVVHPGALRVMAERLAQDPTAGGVACRLLNEDGTLQATVSNRPGPMLLFWRLL